jgi:hypothetical protein
MESTSEIICNKPECTYSQTGQCILGNEPLTCPDRLSYLDLSDETTSSELAGAVVLEAPIEQERFSSSFSLSPESSEKLMRNRYCKVIGILGVPGTGKTATLVSLYLLLAHSKLNGFEFKDSKSIMAFEEISRGARKWSKGNLPEQLTIHTELQDERQAGYLHLRLGDVTKQKAVDLLLTDLPGEWTSSLIDSNRTDRLSFLKSTDRIWIMVNGEEVESTETRKHTIHRLKLLIDRLYAFLSPNMADLTIVLTHCDKHAGVKEHLKDFISKYKGFDIKLIETASFSDNDKIPAGSGISELIGDLLSQRKEKSGTLWNEKDSAPDGRQMLKFKIKM